MRKFSSRFIWGGFFVALGVVFLIDNFLNINIWQSLGRWWPLAIVVLGIWVLVKSPKNIIWAFVMIAFGAVLQLNRLGVTSFNIWNFWPLILIVIGVSLLFKRGSHSDQGAGGIAELSETAIFANVERAIESKHFKSGTVSCLFSAVKLDFTKVEIVDRAELDVTTMFGALELRLPENVEVVNEAAVMLGNFEDKRGYKPVKGNPKLVIKGILAFAEISLR